MIFYKTSGMDSSNETKDKEPRKRSKLKESKETWQVNVKLDFGSWIKEKHFKKHYWDNLGISCSQETYATAFRSEGSFFFFFYPFFRLPSPLSSTRSEGLDVYNLLSNDS